MSASAPAGAAGGRSPAILVVDDEPSNLTAVTEVLSGLGADIVLARSGREALRQVLLRDLCVILMDVRMPEMDGYETTAIIRQRERSRRIPVIFLTAYDKDDAEVFRGYTEGAVDYVFKPVEPVVLRAKVSVFIELHRQSEEIRLKAEQERWLLEENLRIRNDHMEAERQLRSTEDREAMILRSLPIAVYEANPEDGELCRGFLHDDAAVRLLGFPTADFTLKPSLWLDRIHPEDRSEAVGALTGLRPGDSYSVEYRWRRADDGYRHFLDQGIVPESVGGEHPRAFGTMFDVHELRMLEQQLLHAQKIDTVGKLTGGIAHDFNNMLTVVIGNLDGMRRTPNLDPRTSRRVDLALQGALHCRDFTQRLLGFARRQNFAPQVIDLNELIKSLSDLVDRTLGERTVIKKRLASELWPVRSDPSQIESALLNLLVNARDALPDGGSVTIRTANVTASEPATGPLHSLSAGDYVMLEVADSGVGMTKDVLERACEAFYTTKGAGRGTGLGLSTIHGFVRQSGGDLTIESAPDEGTTVRLYMPRDATGASQGRSRADREPVVELPRAPDGDVVLVVEDEESVRQNTVSTLRELGYRVIEAGTAATALDALEQSDEVRLLFTDIIMPGSPTGYQLAREAQRRRPGLRVLFTSAYGGDMIADHGDSASEPFLRKPFRDYELAQAVRNAVVEHG